jgi:hypothetical protein
MSGCNRVKKVAKLGSNLDKVAIHHQDVATARGSDTVAQCPTDSGRGLTIQKFYSRVNLRHGSDNLGSTVRAVIVHENDFVKVLPVHLEKRTDKRTDIHLLVVAGYDDRS